MVKKILVIFGTRPEAIKMSPVINSLRDTFEVTVCITAQHREMLDQVLNLFSIEPDYDLEIMKENQTLFDVTSEVLQGLKRIIYKEKPDLILVHGDTTTTMAASLAGFYEKVMVGHVEAGLRTNKKYSPFPEEMNRQLVSKIADLHFAPTVSSKLNLVKEGIDEKNIYITGNTVIDAMFSVLDQARHLKINDERISFLKSLDSHNNEMNKMILITGHRRENFGNGFKNICNAIESLALDFKEVRFIYPVHLNPNVSSIVRERLDGIGNISLIEPLDYLSFVKLLDLSYIVLTDSGGIQEEAPSLGKPVVLMREVTERPEAVDAGTVSLVGTDSSVIYTEVSSLLNDQGKYERMSKAHNPYGDGTASQKIKDILLRIMK